ncbi:MAG: phosphatase PAP2 family protein [Clostridia bacterium]|nr:phosphatase PAP2 family protein [Clostridia bacterium]
MKVKEFIEKNVKWIALFICLVLVIGIAEDVLDNEIYRLDVIGYNFISKHIISDNITPIVKIITQFGGATFFIALATILLVAIKNKKIGFFIWINLATSALLNKILKHIVQRPRPTEHRIIDESGYSFPSGHSMVSAAFYGLLIYLIYKNVKNKYLKWGLITILSLLIFLIGTSRIYLGVHYTSDVLAGFLVAISYLIVFITAM